MRLHRLALALVVLCYALLLLGGHVHNTRSSLACGTDWPRCHGVWMPRMEGGVLLEHSHRILAALVGLGTMILTIALAVVDRRRGARGSATLVLAVVGVMLSLLASMAVRATLGPRQGEAVPGDLPMLLTGLGLAGALTFAAATLLAFRRRGSLLGWAMVAFGLVTLQGILGALTVVVGLSPVISTAHLGTPMLLFAALVLLAWRTRPTTEAPAVAVPARARLLVATTLGLVYAQMVLGAVVRHVGAGMICGTSIPLCMGTVWPAEAHPGVYLHILHRIVGLALLALAPAVWLELRRATPSPSVRRAALAVPLLLLAQVTLGVVAVLTILNAPTVTAHLGVAAAVFADLVWLLLATRTEGAPARIHGAAPQATTA